MVSLSACIFSDQSPERLAAIVAPLRRVAAEIVVVLDDRVPDPDLAPLRHVADTAFSAPFKWPLEANLEWLHAQCSGDWVLRLDGDEVPSRALIDLLAGDRWHRDVTHCSVPRRWLVDEGASWIEANPWWPDPQMRLIKNEPGLLQFGGEVHQPVDVTGPGRVLGAPIYHLDLIDTDLQSRRAKSRRYYRARPELRTHGGLAMGAYYTPELVTPYPSTVSVPPEDRLSIRAAIAEDYGAAELNRNSPVHLGPTTQSVGTVSLDVVHADRSGYAGQHIEILATVTNTGSESLDSTTDHPFRVGCQWAGGEGTGAWEESRADLPCPLGPGGAEFVLLIAKIPSTAGEYTLSVGALEEGERWLSFAPEISFMVLDQPRATLVGAYSRHRHLGDDVITRALIEDLTDEFPQLHLTLLSDDVKAIADRFSVPTDHSAARIHQANAAQGLTGLESADQAISAARRHLSGEHVEDGSVVDLTEAIGRSDVFVIAAAGSLASSYVDSALWPRLIEAAIASAAGVPVVITSVGIGPFTSDDHRDGAKRLLDLATEIHPRDQLSLRAISELGVEVPTATVCPDAAIAFRGSDGADLAEFLVDIGVPRGDAYLAVSVRAGDDVWTVGRIAQSVEVAARTLGAVAVLLPHCASRWVDDRPELGELASRLASDVDVVCLAEIPPDPMAADLIRNASISIGSRLHNAVLSASAGQPAILFCETEYDEQRSWGLAAMPGAAVTVISTSDDSVVQSTQGALNRSASRPQYPSPHPLDALMHDLGIMR